MEIELQVISDSDFCGECGHCCHGLIAPPFDENDPLWEDENGVEQYEMDFRLPPELLVPLRKFIEETFKPEGGLLPGKGLKPDGSLADCCWFDAANRRCLHYEHRPAACQSFEIGNPHCVDIRREYGMPEFPIPKQRGWHGRAAEKENDDA